MSHHRPVFLTVATFVLAAALVGCSRPVETVAPPPPSLEDTEWVLTLLNGSGLIDGTNITLSFAGGGLSGFAGCNAYGGGPDSGKAIATSDGTLTIPQLAVTVQLCSSPEGVMEQEKAYIEALTKAAAYQVFDHRLEIADPSGKVMLGYTRFESAR